MTPAAAEQPQDGSLGSPGGPIGRIGLEGRFEQRHTNRPTAAAVSPGTDLLSVANAIPRSRETPERSMGSTYPYGNGSTGHLVSVTVTEDRASRDAIFEAGDQVKRRRRVRDLFVLGTRHVAIHATLPSFPGTRLGFRQAASFLS